MFRSTVKAEHIAEIEAAAGRLFAAVHRERPDGLHYASCRLSDGVTYVILLALDDGVENPLPALPEFAEFQEGLKRWLAGPPTTERATVVGSYRLF